MPEADDGRVTPVRLRRDPFLPVTPDSTPTALPEPLRAALFGGDLGCYLLIDGARVSAVEALLEKAAAEGQSLFQGDELEDFAAAGPWLVKLAPDDQLLRLLFTASKAPQHLWGRVNFVLLRSRADASALIAHLQTYIRLQRADGSRPLFRFWDGQVLCDYFEGCASLPQRAARLFGAQGSAPLVETFLLSTRDATGLERFSLSGPLPPEAQTPDPSLTAQDEAIFRAAADRQIVRKVEARLAKRFAELDPAQAHHAEPYARGAMSFIRRFGSGHIADIERDCFQLALVAFLLGPSWPVVAKGPMMREPLVPMSQRIAMLRESYFAALQNAPKEGGR